MSDNVTIARPYAKAIFNHALGNKQLPEWSMALQTLAQVVLDSRASRFISNPNNAPSLQCELLLSVLGESRVPCADNLVHMLAENKRLLLLPDICAQFEVLRAEQEKTLTVQVASFSALSEDQEKQLIQSLSQRLQRQVMLDVSIDKSLLGGAILRAGDFVIDGSVVGQLTKLGATLAA